MKFLLNGLLICLIAILLIAPIGLGAWLGLTNSDQDNVGNSATGEPTDPNLTLSDSEVTFNIGATKTISATTDTESNSYIFQWNTSDKSIVTVKKGDTQSVCELTAIGEGTATVTVNVIDVSKFKIIDSVSCEVTVIDSSIKFSVSEVIISLDEGNSASVSATAPDGGVIAWGSLDESVATVDANGVITAHKVGQVYIIARSGNVEGKLLVKIYNSLFTLEDTKQIGVGASESIQVNGTLSEGAIWTTGDERIATVDQNGVVTGVKAGMTTVKVSSVTDDLTASCVVIVKGSGAEAFELVSGKKAEAAADPKNWYFLCESNSVTIGSIPTMDNGLISLDITNVGTSGANFFYLRYQTDEVGDVIYKHTLYIYSEVDNALIQLNGKDNYLSAGLNRIEIEYTSSVPKANDPYQIKFKSAGKFFVLPIFEEISRIEKMVLSESSYILNTGMNNTVTLTATVPGQDNPEIEWVSSNESVCTIVNGVVTAVGEGSSMITATCGNLSATCLITVEGETPIEGEELTSGNKSATLADPGNWFYLADGKSKVLSTPIMDEDGNIHMSVTNIDTANKKYVYLRYQPESAGAKYKVTISVDFAGADGSVIDINGGDAGVVSMTLKNGTNTFEFEFTSDTKNPLQLKFYAIGGYVVNATLTEI
ncbi:MAG: Ig-like domain-containing protein [Clostridia bacterium]|nr:Ig-like domain-containing protein [Clostridia bacterium]